MLILPSLPTAPRATRSMRRVAQRLVAPLAARLAALRVPCAIVLPDGSRLGADPARVTLTLRDLWLLAPLLRGRIGVLAQAHVEGRLDLDGTPRDLCDVAAALLGADDPVTDATPPGALVKGWSGLLRASRSLARHSPQRDRAQVEFHYDVSNDFYALWLDERRVYSCAYWPEGVNSLAAAQEAKLELICRKLMLAPGDRLLDVGAGWGALLVWAAERHGAQAHGITLSREQHAHVQQLIDARGLRGRVSVALCDYRELPETEPYDKIASVGMFEHVGHAQLPIYFGKLWRLLAPGGLLLNHGITAAGVHNPQLGAGIGDFVERYIFPGGELVHAAQVLAAMAEAGLETLDMENLRPHYARTLWAWSDALEQRLDAARALTSERVLRAYRLYLAGSAMGFERGWMALHQMLATRPTGRVEGTRLRGAQSVYPFQRDHVLPCSPLTESASNMLYKFKSKAAGDVIMTAPVGDAILRRIGREPAPQGIFEAADLPATIAALEAAIATDETARDAAESQARQAGHAPGPREGVTLRQRAWPLIEMMRRAQAAGQEIVWGV